MRTGCCFHRALCQSTLKARVYPSFVTNATNALLDKDRASANPYKTTHYSPSPSLRFFFFFFGAPSSPVLPASTSSLPHVGHAIGLPASFPNTSTFTPTPSSQNMLRQIEHTNPRSTTRLWQKHAARKSTVGFCGGVRCTRVEGVGSIA